MSVNLATAYAKKLSGYFRAASFVKGRTGIRYSMLGARSLRIYSLQTVPLNDYSRGGTSRYGTPEDIQDIVQEVSMTQDKSFAGIIDKGDKIDQNNVKNAMQWLRQEIDEVVTPTSDKYALAQFVKNAGIVMGVSAAPTKTTITEMLAGAMAEMDDRLVPLKGRTIYITTKTYNLLRLSPEFVGASESVTKNALTKGAVGEFMNADVVKVPSAYLPADCFALVAYKNSLMYPWKIDDTRVHKDPPGISGDLIEGRVYYDAFVVGGQCDGVLALVLDSKKQAAPSVTASTGAITSSGASVIKYTTDGSDPRYSFSSAIYTAAIGAQEAGTVIKAVAYKTNGFTSDVAEAAA